MAHEILFKVIHKSADGVVGYEKLTESGWKWMSLALNPEGKELWYDGVFQPSSSLIRCQFTGRIDRNKVKIFEGDKVKCFDWGGNKPFLHNDFIIWDEDANGWNFNYSNWVEDGDDFRKALAICEVFGSIHIS